MIAKSRILQYAHTPPLIKEAQFYAKSQLELLDINTGEANTNEEEKNNCILILEEALALQGINSLPYIYLIFSQSRELEFNGAISKHFSNKEDREHQIFSQFNIHEFTEQFMQEWKSSLTILKTNQKPTLSLNTWENLAKDALNKTHDFIALAEREITHVEDNPTKRAARKYYNQIAKRFIKAIQDTIQKHINLFIQFSNAYRNTTTLYALKILIILTMADQPPSTTKHCAFPSLCNCNTRTHANRIIRAITRKSRLTNHEIALLSTAYKCVRHSRYKRIIYQQNEDQRSVAQKKTKDASKNQLQNHIKTL